MTGIRNYAIRCYTETDFVEVKKALAKLSEPVYNPHDASFFNQSIGSTVYVHWEGEQFRGTIRYPDREVIGAEELFS